MYSNTLKFIGTSPKINKPENGMVKIEGSTYMIYVENKDWEPICDIPASTTTSVSFPEPKVLRPKICACCNAPLKADKCEYCGVEYG